MMSNGSNGLGTWITLSQAAQFAARLGGVDERIVVLMDADIWALEASHSWLRGVQEKWAAEDDEFVRQKTAEFQVCIEQAKKTLATLRQTFASGKVQGEGSHTGPGPAQPLAPITELEWASRYVDFWKNELQPKGSDRERFPAIVAVRVRTDDVRWELEARFPRPPRTKNEKKRAAVDAAIRHFGVEVLSPLRQKIREQKVIARVRETEKDLTVTDRYVRDRWREAKGNIRRS
jgi:hypothetical protein